jgi:hypothetical protein
MTGATFRKQALLLAAALWPGSASAQIYECIDARGAREFAQVCSPGTVRQRQVSRDDDATPAAAPETKSTAQQEIEFKKRLQERQDAEAKAAADRAKAEEAERNCAQARVQLKALLEGQRMQRLDPVTGDRVNLGDEERAADAARQQKLVEQWCK